MKQYCLRERAKFANTDFHNENRANIQTLFSKLELTILEIYDENVLDMICNVELKRENSDCRTFKHEIIDRDEIESYIANSKEQDEPFSQNATKDLLKVIQFLTSNG